MSSGASSTRSSTGSDEPEPVVVGKKLSRIYNRGRSSRFSVHSRDRTEVTALRDVSITVNRGEFVAVSGPSGSGKSTLLHLLGGLDTPTAGTVELLGQDLTAATERQRAKLRLNHVGVVFQHFHLLPSLHARSNVAVPLIEQGLKKRVRRERAMSLLEEVGLEDRAKHRPGQLSGGEQQRVAIARALATDPDLVLGDEPTGEVDSATAANIIELLRGLGSNRAVIVASHDPQVVEAADRVMKIRDGREVN